MYKKDEWREDWQNEYNIWRNAGEGEEWKPSQESQLEAYSSNTYMECRKVGGHGPNNLEHGETMTAMMQQKQTQANTIGRQILTATLLNFPPNFSGTRSDIFMHFYVPKGGSFILILTYFTIFLLQGLIKKMPILLKVLGSPLNFPLFSIFS